MEGNVRIREDVPVIAPDPNASVSKLPEEFARVRGEIYGKETKK